jgi:hypothetical protein
MSDARPDLWRLSLIITPIVGWFIAISVDDLPLNVMNPRLGQPAGLPARGVDRGTQAFESWRANHARDRSEERLRPYSNLEGGSQ